MPLLSSGKAFFFHFSKAKLNGIISISRFLLDLCDITWASLNNGDRHYHTLIANYLGHAHFDA